MQIPAFLQKKYPAILQYSEEDCGAACLATVAKYYGAAFPLNRIREALGTGQQGTTLLDLKRGAEAIGFNARSVKASPEILDRIREVPLPVIAHWIGYHWVVFYGQQGKHYIIADPAVGVRYLTRKELTEGWTDWVMLLLEPDLVRLHHQSDEPTSSINRFFRRIWAYRLILAQVLLINAVLGLLSLASPFLIQILTDDVLVRQDMRLLNAVAIAVVVMNVFSSSLGLVQSNLIAHFAQRLELGLVLEFGRQILRLPLQYYETRRSGEIVSRLQDIQAINQLISQVIVSLPALFFVAVVSLCFMLLYSWKLFLAAILLAIAMTLSTVTFLPILQQKTRRALALETENQGVLVETFKGALTLKTTNASSQFWEELQDRFSRLANLNFRTTQIGITNTIFAELVSSIGSIILLWFGSMLVIQDELSIGQLLAFNSLNRNIVLLISTAIAAIDEFTRVEAATKRLTEVIDSTPETQGDAKKAFAKISSKADIVCTNLTFHYSGRVNLLQDFSLTIPGEKVTAFIGSSGCGKSTLAKLIAGLYPLQSGNIRLDIYNLQDLSLECLRQQIVLIPQDSHFWSRSILENFRLGYPQATFGEIVSACQIVGADEFITQLPDKYQTILGEFGANLSGGQRQRLAIARGILTDPPVLILDESTAGLDPESEAYVLDQLLSHRRSKTTILIAHHPRVINRADWIVALDNGQLITQGSLEELHNQPGIHQNFINIYPD